MRLWISSRVMEGGGAGGAGKGSGSGTSARGSSSGSGLWLGLRRLGLGWRSWRLRLLRHGLHLTFDLGSLCKHQSGFLTGHGEHLELLEVHSFRPPDLYRSGMFNLREDYNLQNQRQGRYQCENDQRSMLRRKFHC